MSDLEFKICIEDLTQYFINEHISEGESFKKLTSIGGVGALFELLHTSASKGISENASEKQLRRSLFGDNKPYIKERDSIFYIISKSFKDFSLQILMCAGLISLVIGLVQDPDEGWYEGVAILLTALIVISVTSINDYMKDEQFIKLSQESFHHKAIVVREGREKEIFASELLVGDILLINPGDIFSIDGILVKGSGLVVDESAITGESASVTKNAVISGDLESNCFVISGTKVNEGNGLVLVCSVGKNTISEKHRVLSEKLDEEMQTPLQERLEVLASWLAKVGVLAGVFIITVLMFYTFLDVIDDDQWGDDEWDDTSDAFILGIIILVVAIPEGLPLAMTITMIYSILRMKKENIFVRHLRGCEIMGAATNILSDKTGTLTENKMKVAKGYLFDTDILNMDFPEISAKKKNVIAEIIARNTCAFESVSNGTSRFVGNKTEGALVEMIKTWNCDYSAIRATSNKLYQYPFNSITKRMTTVYENDITGYSVYCTGAPESIIDYCDTFYNSREIKEKLTYPKRLELSQKISRFSSESLRVLGIAYKIANLNSVREPCQESFEKDLVFVGLVAIEDPLRPDAKKCVELVKASGVTVRMVTGDNIETAVSIAKQAGILPSDVDDSELSEYVMSGRDFRESVGGLIKIETNSRITGFQVGNIRDFERVATKLKVLARCSPEDKLLLVVGLKELGEVVAVTGDGSNDAAALKQSDIGLAMMSGTQLAKESSDIILLDDNFSSILNSIKWGRNVYASTRKFLQFQLIINFVALTMTVIGGVVVQEPPLSAIQILWVNLIQDSFAALALATEPPSDDLIYSKPFGRTEPIINFDMYVTIITQTVLQISILTVLLFVGPDLFDVEEGWNDNDWTENNGKHFTIFFQTFVMLQLFNEINCRKLSLSEVNVFKGIFNNWMFVGIVCITLVIQIVFIEFGGEALKCSPLTFGQHVACIAIASIGLFFALALRISVFIYRKSQKNAENPEENEPLIK